MFGIRKCIASSIVLAILAAVVPASAGIVVYTDQASFLAAVNPGYYQESFDSLPAFTIFPDTMSFSQGAFGYDIFADGYGTNEGLITLENTTIPGDVWMSTTFALSPLIVQNLSGGINAIGGNFFLTDSPGQEIDALMTTTVGNGTIQEINASFVGSSSNFLGFVTTDGSTFTNLSITSRSTNSSLQFATMNDLIVGRSTTIPVPEPAGFATMAIGLGLAAFALRRRRQAQE